MPGLHRRDAAGMAAVSCSGRGPAVVQAAWYRPQLVRCQKPEELRRIRFRKGLVSFKERQIQRTQPVIEAAVDVEQQVAWVGKERLRSLTRALDFRQWTARGKGLVLLNVLVSADILLSPRNTSPCQPAEQLPRSGLEAPYTAMKITFCLVVIKSAGGAVRQQLGGRQGLRRQLRPLPFCALQATFLPLPCFCT